MKLQDLDHEERIALAGLVKRAVLADRIVSHHEAAEIDWIAEAWGVEAYRAAMDEACLRMEKKDGLESLLEAVGRREAQELIYEVLLEIAMADSVNPEEGRILGLLTRKWGVEATFEPEPVPPPET